ncbi:GTPase IMAP family member 8-like [Genypterus blacodes]|uniref:GTPase IMAP family member 8-like n=1 Tax=Genypterus blacodes TaxID=154954 RepID=UPI003F76350F
MEASLRMKESTIAELRLILIGGRWAGKSSCGNTILTDKRFECGRSRTAQSELRHGEVAGRKLSVVDAVGWSSSLSLAEIPERDKERFKLNPFRCLPGPHAFLLVVPIDSAFASAQRRTLEEHMKLLGGRVWRYTMVLFTCGDYLNGRTIETHIESEGEALKWLIQKCRNRYCVFFNKEKYEPSQVTGLLEKIDEMVQQNSGGYYEVDEPTLRIIETKQQEETERAKKRQERAEEERQYRKHMRTLDTPEEMKPNPQLQIVLLGSRNVGKTSLGNTILGFKEQDNGKRTAHAAARRGYVSGTEITLVDTPGWWKGFSAVETPEAIKEEVRRSMFLCPPGPHVFLLVIDADASFTAPHMDAVTKHLELLGDVWSHTIVVFTRGDWLGDNTIEEFIEGEGEALQNLVERCGNRYHVIDNKNVDDGTQVTELLEKISEVGNEHFVPDEQILLTMEERRMKVEAAAQLRRDQVDVKRKSFRGLKHELKELRIVMLGRKTAGKSATGNTLLHKQAFATFQNEICAMGKADVAGRQVTVIDTPGWCKNSSCTKEVDKQIVRGLSFCPTGVHAVLLVVPLDMSFREAQLAAIEEHVNLFDVSVWKHAIVVFTYGDNLAEKSIEEHIEREPVNLRRLVDKCENRYHVINNKNNADMSQITDLFEKIEEMMAGNDDRLFIPNMDDIQCRIEEKFIRWELKQVMRHRLEEEIRRRELELIGGFRQTLIDLQTEIRGNAATTPKFPKLEVGDIRKLTIGQRKKDGKEKVEPTETNISKEDETPDEDIQRSSGHRRNSTDIIFPKFHGEMSVPQCPTDSQPAAPNTKQKLQEMMKVKPMAFGQWKKGKEKGESIESKINKEIEKLDKEMLQSTRALSSSQDIIRPTFSAESPVPLLSGSSSGRREANSNFDQILRWIATLQIGANEDNQLTLNFSQTSGYASVYDLYREGDMEKP